MFLTSVLCMRRWTPGRIRTGKHRLLTRTTATQRSTQQRKYMAIADLNVYLSQSYLSVAEETGSMQRMYGDAKKEAVRDE